MKVLLSSKGIGTDKYKVLFLSKARGFKKEVSIITTASEKYKERNKNVLRLKERLLALGFTSNFVDVEFEGLSQLSKSEIIILSGGNPYYLLFHLKKSKADRLILEKIRNENLVIGISAGIFVLMKSLSIVDLLTPKMNKIGLVDKKGLGIVREIIIPHYDRFVREGIIDEKLVEAFEKKHESNIIRLNELDAIEYSENDYRLI